MATGKKVANQGKKKRLGRTTVRSSSRTRAQRAGKSDNVLPGRRGTAKGSAVIDKEHEEVYGVLLSEHRRCGNTIPALPESKTRNTRSAEPKRTPRTGLAKRRRS